MVQFYRIGISYIDHDNQYLNHSLLDTIGQLLNVSLNVVLIVVVLILMFGITQKSLVNTRLEIDKNKLKSQILLGRETKYRELVESFPVGMSTHRLIYDISGKAVDYTFISANAAFEHQTGLEINLDLTLSQLRN